MKPKANYRGRLHSYLQWPIFLGIFLIIMNVIVYFFEVKAGVVVSVFLGIYLILLLVLYIFRRPLVLKEMIAFASEYGQVQKKLLEELSIPYGLLDSDGRILWMNAEMRELFGKDNRYQKKIRELLEEVTEEQFPQENEAESFDVTYKNHDYRVEVRRVKVADWIEAEGAEDAIADSLKGQNYLYAFYMFETTELNRYVRENEEEKLVIGLIYIDNYEEVLESIDDVRRSLLLALVERKIDRYISNYHGVMKKLEKDKYYVVLKQKYLNAMMTSRFTLLEEVKTVDIGNDMKITLSIGMGAGGESYPQTHEFAHAAIELALGRGGDQAVIKENSKISYFGGKTQQVEKSTKVKARVKAQALREFMIAREDIIVMGHKVTDIDTLGAAVGIYRAARSIGKHAHILVDENSASIRPYLKLFRENKDYDADLFINHAQADDLLRSETLLVVVDTNRPSNTEYPELLEKAKTIMVLDHHRQSTEIIANAALSYIEPYASSACEMVAEILQYFNDGIKLNSIEADCVYAGIIVDTNNFVAKTGVRTFEAAAYLRRCGADVTRVRKIMRNDIVSYKARAEAVRGAELYRDCYAIAALPNQNLDSPTIVGAQAANELLNMIGVKASFVMVEYNSQIYISARSIDEINVQIIMERLGGGGHLNIAGAQLRDVTVEEARQKLKTTIDTMTAEGAI
ncbi:MAG: DHH family phosphoesterase [Eubacteriales bacterium]|nr:DHH family phosphoesterase [Eubacteriales bacterium]